MSTKTAETPYFAVIMEQNYKIQSKEPQPDDSETSDAIMIKCSVLNCLVS